MIVPMEMTSANALVTCPIVFSRPILIKPGTTNRDIMSLWHRSPGAAVHGMRRKAQTRPGQTQRGRKGASLVAGAATCNAIADEEA